MKTSIFFTLFFLSAVQLFSQTIIEDQSEISGVWDVSGSPYLINGEAIVPQNETLLIKPGVVVEFKTGTNHDYVNPLFDLGFLRVKGTLQVKGKPDSMVIFTRQGDTGQWGILFFDETASDSCLLQFTRIEHASYIKYLLNWIDYNGAISVTNTPVVIENCQITNNSSDGIYVKSAATQFINCLVNDNNGYGIRMLMDSDLQIINCTIVYNGLAGVDCGVNSQPQIINSILYGNAEDLEIGKYSLPALNHCLLQASTLPDQVVSQGKNFPGKNPHFVNPEGQDYHLAPNSWAVNTGLADSTQFIHTSTDLDGNPRIRHGRIDLGVLERNADFLRVEYPIGNESFLQNSFERIRWTGNVKAVEIDYSSDEGASWQPITVYSGEQPFFEWNVPALISENCFIRITAQDNPNITDISDTTFIISDHTIIRAGLSVSGKWLKAGSPVEVRGAAFVEKDSTLEIEPGVKVLFKGGTNFDYSSNEFDAAFLQVKGHLQAQGMQTDTILFTSTDADQNWGGLIIEDADSLGSALTFVKIEQAYGVDSLEGQNFPAALSISGANTRIEQVKIADNPHNGLLIKGQSNPLITNCVIESNGLNGILAVQASKFPEPEIANNVIRFNGLHGLFVNGIFEARIHDNLITHNDSCGVKLSSGYAVAQFVNNRIGYQKIGIFCDNAAAKLVGNVVYHCQKGLLLDNASPDMGNLTLADNTTAIWGNTTSSILTNVLFAGNDYDFSFPAGDNSSLTISYSITDKYFFPAQVSDVGFNQYANKINFSKKSPHYYALTSGSKAIDSGTEENSLISLPQTDVAGKPRIMDGNNDGTATIDIGAYEFGEIQANFKASPTAGKLPLKVTFTDQSRGEIDHWYWDFGDGQTDSLTNPTHIYQKPGRFDVSLIVTGLAGSDTLTRRQYIYAKNPPFVCHPVPDTSFYEDSDWQFIARLNQVFCDSDSTAQLSFSATTSSSQILKSLKNDSLFVKGTENFYGQGKIFLKAQDQLYLSALDTLEVSILSVNDVPYFEIPLPDSICFPGDSSAVLNLWDYAADVETPDSLLSFEIHLENDSLFFDFDTATGLVTIWADINFSGQSWLFVKLIDDSMAAVDDSILIKVHTVTSIEEKEAESIPKKFFLSQNFPNPFNPSTTIEFGLPGPQTVKLVLYDVRGRKITTLVERPLPAGVHRRVISMKQINLSSGVYFVVMKAGNFSAVRKLILIK